MKRVWQMSVKVVAGLAVTAMYAMPQAYTISAKPGVVNYIEGNASLNGKPVTVKREKPTILNTDDTLSTGVGKAEVLLTPGVFLRLGDNSAVRMISPSLTDMQVAVERGEVMLEVDELLKDNHLVVLDHNASTTIEKAGLYRFTAGDQPRAAVMDGKAVVQLDDRKVDLGKGHETLLAGNLKSGKFDAKKEDDLYAWSNVRSRYAAAASYQAANNVGLNSASYGGFGGYGGFGWGGFGFGPWYSPGWYWNSAFNSYAWLPGMGAFYNPFGYGFYAPAVVAYAPVVTTPIRGGGYWLNGRWVARGPAAVAVNPRNPPAGTVSRSPAAYQAARTQTMRTFAPSGFRTASGMHVPAGRAAAGYTGPARGFAGPARSNAGYAGPRGGGNFGGGHVGGGNFGAAAAGHSGSTGAPAGPHR
ncbi:MAG TPA: hypothetical protein VFB14_13325 [Bryobacteraceae bacterium]|jgi:hypothetical protein|nr:hypothetical protein [Bryobacteraceae bacterium]